MARSVGAMGWLFAALVGRRRTVQVSLCQRRTGRYRNYAYDTADRVAAVTRMTNGADRPDGRLRGGQRAAQGYPGGVRAHPRVNNAAAPTRRPDRNGRQMITLL